MQSWPPYISWSVFLKTVDVLRPLTSARLDATMFGGLAASTAGQMLQAFRFLRLVTADGKVLPDLSLLVEHAETRPALVAKLLRQSYPEVFASIAADVSRSALEHMIGRTGLSAATQRKAVTFFLNAAHFAGLAVTSLPKPHAARDEARVSSAAKKSLSVELRSGGSIEFIADIDPLRLDREDREFVFDLVDRLKGYRDTARREDHPQSVWAGDEEVPF
jgi:hypothetical protein